MDFNRWDAFLIIAAGVTAGVLSLVYDGTAGEITMAAFGSVGYAFILDLVWRPMSQLGRLFFFSESGRERYLAQSRWFARPLPRWREGTRRYRRSVVAFLTVLSLALLEVSALIVLDAGSFLLALYLASAIPLIPLGRTISNEIDRFAESANRPT